MHWAKFRTAFVILLCWGVFYAIAPGKALAQQPPASGKKSWMDSISSGIKSGWNKVGGALHPTPQAPTPKPTCEDDAVSLNSKGKAGPDLYVAVARLYEQSGKFNDAERQYLAALQLQPNHLPALLGRAQLKDRLGLPDEALRIYQQAAKAYPQKASVFNNMGLCYARCGRTDQALALMVRAIQLAPNNKRYRNNIATILVNQGRLDEAFMQLKETHGEAAAYYNMGFLLNNKRRTQDAMRYFSLALRADPSMTAAQRWMQHLQRTAARQRLPHHPASEGVKIVQPKPNAEPRAPQRLPPVPAAERNAEARSLPGISHNQARLRSAPMPPGRNNMVHPLPRTD